ncbi:2-C-methyl-D-erythritol 4-phosphate cytidylyltransferase [Bacillus salitolerans]|uniref:2-C-methyl-D-erythritol 4-phosphate cytidylyltransferase n=1 Tax=Bacillus salitolerans TaxID=1437434 RepID=A0ABW4LT47_9BACI
MNYKVVIPAAGLGKRMNAGMNKQFITLNGKPVIIHTLTVFENDPKCIGISLVVNRDDRKEFEALLSSYHISKVDQLVLGGKERQDSVWNGLQKTSSTGLVLVHDGARPFITQEKIHELIDAAEKNGAAILAVPVKDTIKKVTNGLVDETVERSSLWAVQTPQAFHMQLLEEAFRKADIDHFIGTDEASLVERLDRPVVIVAGDYENIKLTTQEDLLYGESILMKRQK